MTVTDPASLTPVDRLREITALLACAYLRAQIRQKESQKALAEVAKAEAPWARVVNTER